MSLLSIFKPKHKIDWQKRQDLLIQLELVWGSVSDYRFGQFITKVYDSYRTRCFGMERVRYMHELSETDWLNILHFCSRDPKWKMGEVHNDLHPSDNDPKRIRELITHLGSYWNLNPHKTLGEVVTELCDKHEENMYSFSDDAWLQSFTVLK